MKLGRIIYVYKIICKNTCQCHTKCNSKLSQPETSDMDLRRSSCCANVHKSLALTCAWLVLTREISQGLIPSFPLFDVLIDILISSLLRKKNTENTFKCVYVFSLILDGVCTQIVYLWLPSIKSLISLERQLGAAWGPWTASSVSRWVPLSWKV